MTLVGAYVLGIVIGILIVIGLLLIAYMIFVEEFKIWRDKE